MTSSRLAMVPDIEQRGAAALPVSTVRSLPTWEAFSTQSF